MKVGELREMIREALDNENFITVKATAVNSLRVIVRGMGMIEGIEFSEFDVTIEKRGE